MACLLIRMSVVRSECHESLLAISIGPRECNVHMIWPQWRKRWAHAQHPILKPTIDINMFSIGQSKRSNFIMALRGHVGQWLTVPYCNVTDWLQELERRSANRQVAIAINFSRCLLICVRGLDNVWISFSPVLELKSAKSEKVDNINNK